MKYPWIFVLIFLGLTILFTLLIYGIGTYIKWQAHKTVKRFYAPIPRSGTFAFSVLEGRVVKIIENVAGWALDENGLFKLDKKKKKTGFLERYLGVMYIGFFATIKTFEKWHWPEFRQVKKKDKDGKEIVKYEVEAREENVSEFFFQFPYSVVIEDIELKGNIQVTLNAVFTVFFLNPTRAIFLNKDPVDLFIAMVRSAVRAWMSEKDFNEIKQITVSSNKSADQISGFWEMLEEFNGLKFEKDGPDKGQPIYSSEEPRGLYGKLGIAIVRVELEQIEPVGLAAEALEATRLAQLRGEAKIAEEEKTAKALIVAAQGRLEASERDAIAQRNLNEQNAGYYASLPGGARMFAANQVSSKDSSVSTWVEPKSDIEVTLPLPPAPIKPQKPQKPEEVSSEGKMNPEVEKKPAKKSRVA